MDLVLIYGCVLVTSWAAVAFDDFATGAQASPRAGRSKTEQVYMEQYYGIVECHVNQLDAVCFSLFVYVLLGAVVPTFLSAFVLLKENSLCTPESTRLHQVHPNKAGQVLDKNIPAAITTL